MMKDSNIGAIVLLGAPGAGKGTQARELSRLWTIPHISTGELLRTNVAEGTRLGRTAQDIMKRGDLVPDTFINEMVKSRLAEPDAANGFILDGFPRTLDQATWLTKRLARERRVPVLPIRIHIGRNELIRRITGRRHCPRCNAGFNIFENRPRTAGHCDLDNEPLIQRPDDTEETAIRRLNAYDATIAPIIMHFQTRGRFVDVSGDGPIEWITQRIVGAHHLAAYEAHVQAVRTTAYGRKELH